MILESLRDLSVREGLLENPDYEPKPVSWIILVDDGGRLINVVPTACVGAGRRPRPKVFSVPRRVGRTSVAVADFLVDKSEYVLGIVPEAKRSAEELVSRRVLFLKAIRDAQRATGTEALAAVEAFLESDSERGRAIDRVCAVGYKSNDLLAFEYRGRLVHDLPEVQQYFSHMRRATSGVGMQCLICGQARPPVDKHPAVKIPGGCTGGIALVSFNSDAFESFGLLRNENAPVCRDCADAYTTALNRLLSDAYPDPRHPGEALPRRFVRLSPDTTAVFWQDGGAELADRFHDYFDNPSEEKVNALFESPCKGRTPAEADDRFYCLILSGAQGRAILRSAHTGTVAQVEENLRVYFECMDISSERPLPLIFLTRNLVVQGKLENLVPGLVTNVFIAIVFGGLFPRTLLTRAVGRCRTERRVTRERAAILRAYVRRNEGLEVNVGLDRENTSAGYRLGRLMAVLERAQAAAQNNPNKKIVDRYYGAASTRPATVFPTLIASTELHASKLKPGLQYFISSLLGEVMDGIPAFPPVLSMEEQGLFALGYYHQRQDFYKSSEEEPEQGTAA